VPKLGWHSCGEEGNEKNELVYFSEPGNPYCAKICLKLASIFHVATIVVTSCKLQGTLFELRLSAGYAGNSSSGDLNAFEEAARKDGVSEACPNP
jgi:hypothetical protein